MFNQSTPWNQSISAIEKEATKFPEDSFEFSIHDSKNEREDDSVTIQVREEKYARNSNIPMA